MSTVSDDGVEESLGNCLAANFCLAGVTMAGSLGVDTTRGAAEFDGLMSTNVTQMTSNWITIRGGQNRFMIVKAVQIKQAIIKRFGAIARVSNNVPIIVN